MLTIQDIIQRCTPVFRAGGVKRAVLFGSYAKGSATPQSDVDLLVDSGLRGLDFVGLIESVREALETEVDLIDTHYLAQNSRLDREIQTTGMRIYG